MAAVRQCSVWFGLLTKAVAALVLSSCQVVVDRAPEIEDRASPEPFAHFTRARASLGLSPE
jgi:hypothetical protein